MSNLNKVYPPYEGDKPYIYLCFSKASKRKVLGLLYRLGLRGVRVWYCEEISPDIEQLINDEKKACKAAITVVFLDNAFRNDTRVKSRLLDLQDKENSILCLNTDRGDGGLSVGLHPDVPEVKLRRLHRSKDAENAILRAEAFSHEFIGKPIESAKYYIKILTKRAVIVSACLVALFISLFFVHRSLNKEIDITANDTVTFSDETIRETIRTALGGGELTDERLADIDTLYLEGDMLPTDLSDIDLLPSLKTIIISQKAVSGLKDHPELDGYEIELFGGESE